MIEYDTTTFLLMSWGFVNQIFAVIFGVVYGRFSLSVAVTSVFDETNGHGFGTTRGDVGLHLHWTRGFRPFFLEWSLGISTVY